MVQYQLLLYTYSSRCTDETTTTVDPTDIAARGIGLVRATAAIAETVATETRTEIETESAIETEIETETEIGIEIESLATGIVTMIEGELHCVCCLLQAAKVRMVQQTSTP